MDRLIDGLRALGGLAAVGTLAVAFVAIFQSLRRPGGRTDRGGRAALRPPIVLLVMLVFLMAGILLWRPLPIQPSLAVELTVTLLGGLLLFAGLGLYLWGLRNLGRMFGPSGGFAVRLQEHHRLVTTGPYALIRHPMYVAAIMVGLGILLLYPTWATLAFSVAMLGLVVRARREERILLEEFGPEWQAYADRVPGWLPRIRRGRRTSASSR
ncbi:MAG TPA: isoprenylcysteine carboxylmethyltransferase family protein [Anaerolineales bacterium]|nr:isoprenylcysteine carboxylmethyltransferase family protein [Anaerolineales bacterium]